LEIEHTDSGLITTCLEILDFQYRRKVAIGRGNESILRLPILNKETTARSRKEAGFEVYIR
jgi:hypothetical protein